MEKEICVEGSQLNLKNSLLFEETASQVTKERIITVLKWILNFAALL